MLTYTYNLIYTGKSFSEALILASVNPQYEKRLFIEFPEKYTFTTCFVQKLFFVLFWHLKQYLYTTCCELVFFGEFNEQSLPTNNGAKSLRSCYLQKKQLSFFSIIWCCPPKFTIAKYCVNRKLPSKRMIFVFFFTIEKCFLRSLHLFKGRVYELICNSKSQELIATTHNPLFL